MAQNVTEYVYTQLATRVWNALRTAFPDERPHIDLWNSQPDLQAAEGKPVQSPAVYFDFDEIDWASMSDGAQQGEIRLGVYVVQQTLANTAHNEDSQGRALAILQYLQVIHIALQNFHAETEHDPEADPQVFSIGGFSKLDRRKWRVHADYAGGRIAHRIEYEFLMVDTATYELQNYLFALGIAGPAIAYDGMDFPPGIPPDGPDDPGSGEDTELQELIARIEALETSYGQLVSENSAQQAEIDLLQTQQTAAAAAIAALQAADAALDAAIDVLQGQLDDQGADIAAIQAAIAALEAADTAIEARLDDAEADISALQAAVAALETAVQVLDGRVDTAEIDIDALQAAVAALQAADTAFDTRLDDAEIDIADLAARVTALENAEQLPDVTFISGSNAQWLDPFDPFGVFALTPSTGSPSTNARAILFKVPRNVDLHEFMFRVTTGVAAANGSWGIYACTNAGIPTSRVVDLGTFDVSAAGLFTNTVSGSLSAGVLYALAYHFSSGSVALRVRSGASVPMVLGTNDASTIAQAQSVTAYAPLGATFPGSPATAAAVSIVPFVRLRTSP